jgi:hypothetical protein
MRAPYVDLIEVGDAAVAGGGGYVFELNVHVVFGCRNVSSCSVHMSLGKGCEYAEGLGGNGTFEQFSTVDLAGR